MAVAVIVAKRFLARRGEAVCGARAVQETDHEAAAEQQPGPVEDGARAQQVLGKHPHRKDRGQDVATTPGPSLPRKPDRATGTRNGSRTIGASVAVSSTWSPAAVAMRSATAIRTPQRRYRRHVSASRRLIARDGLAPDGSG
ncbi:MAG: hypothetical protein U1E86_28885 [Burkholderiaceae bacterium]